MSIEFSLIYVLCIFLPSVTVTRSGGLCGNCVAACDESVQVRHIFGLPWKRNKPFLRHILI